MGIATRLGPVPARNRPARGEHRAHHLAQTLTSAALVHLRASPECLRSWGRSIRPLFQRDRNSGTRMYGSRTRTVPPRASTEACDCAGTSGSGAVRWRKCAQTIPVEIRAWRIALIWEVLPNSLQPKRERGGDVGE